MPGRPGGTPYGDGVPLTGSVATTVVAGLLVLVGLVGILVPVLPGPVLVVAGIAVWAVPRNDAVGWTVLGVAVGLVVLGSVLKYLLPGRRMRDAGVPGRTLVAGGLLGIVGFFVVPVVGLLLGFVLGVYLAEMARVGRARGMAVGAARPDRGRLEHPDRAGGRRCWRRPCGWGAVVAWPRLGGRWTRRSGWACWEPGAGWAARSAGP